MGHFPHCPPAKIRYLNVNKVLEDFPAICL